MDERGEREKNIYEMPAPILSRSSGANASSCIESHSDESMYESKDIYSKNPGNCEDNERQQMKAQDQHRDNSLRMKKCQGPTTRHYLEAFF